MASLEPFVSMQRSKIGHEGAQIRRRGAHDFLAYYDFVCGRQDSVPLPAVTMNLDKGMLDFNGDMIKPADWPPILDSIAINKQLHHVAISSTYQSLGPGDADRIYFRTSMKKKIPTIRSKDMTFKLSKALRDTLTVSPNLKTLQLNGLPLRERDLTVLTKGLAKSVSLENLSLANCPISDEGLEIICQSVKYSASIRTVDFTGCNLTWRGAEHMANIIKHQGMQRHGTAWAESLRYRQPHFERMTGLRRVTLNCNSLIGDRGAAALANELAEDLWVKAVDLQRCGLSNEGARRLLETLKTNSTLSVLDVRSNPLIDKVLIKTILEKVLMNADGESPEFIWIKPTVTDSQRTAGFKRRALPSSFRGKSLSRNALRKTNSSVLGGSRVTHQKSCSQLRYFPWRTAARAGRQRGLPPGATVVDQSFQGAASVKIIVNGDSEEDEEPDIVLEVEQKPSSPAAQDEITERQFRRLQMELKECRLMLAEERRARLRSETRLKEFELESARLRTANLSLTETLANSSSAPAAFSALEDEAVLESIENSFKKFHAFLDLLKDAGLDQLVSMAGLEKSDFQPLGKPQLSSTVGPPLGATLSRDQQVNTFGDLRTETSLSAKVLSPPPITPAVVVPTQSSSSSAASCHGDNLLDVTFTQTAKSAQVPVVDGEPAVDQRSERIKRYAGGSIQTYHSQRSHSPHSHSNHSNGSQAYSDASHRSSRLSSKSSIREVISDKVDSDRSLTSPESGRDDMNRITSLRGLGTQSFSTLF